MLEFERIYLKEGKKLIAGVDEAGRGPLAGPLVCACVIMPLDEKSIIVDVKDSKKLTPLQRERIYPQIVERALYHNVSIIDPRVIDKINIYNANMRAMKLSVMGLGIVPDIVLLDGKGRIKLPCEQQFIVGGDSASYSIAAASIVAKVVHDHIMMDFDKQFPQYHFAAHKGYGTPDHMACLREHGECEIHRQTFLRKFKAGLKIE